MNILLVHNFYQQPGGEDQVFADETSLLRGRGHSVRQLTIHNDAVEEMGRVELARKTLWNSDFYRTVRSAVREHRAEVVHCHNTFPLISPAAYRAAHDEGAAVVQTLHNYRLLCPNAAFYRNHRVCEDCMHRTVPWPGVVHACYRGSRAATAVVATMLTAHRLRGTWRNEVDLFIALTGFSMRKFIEGGFDERKIVVKPNFVDPDPGVGHGEGGFALFVGRLTEEKGIPTLLKAWELISEPVRLVILGDGPMRELVQECAARDPRIEYLGRQPLQKVCDIMGDAGVLLFPSEWYEGLPRTIIESYAKGTPVVASRLGSMAELVDDGRTGWLFEPGNPVDLARQAREALASPMRLADMRRQARTEYEQFYMAARNYELLMSAYETALGRASQIRRAERQAEGEMTP